jgi:pantetheine-phosphate adenylyltransferase
MNLTAKPYQTAIVGGTFDRVHQGHVALIKTAFECGREVIVGLTSDGFIANKKYAELILPFNDRKKAIDELIAQLGFTNEYRIVEINDVYGETLADLPKSVLVVSQQTFSGAQEVNKRRCELDLPLMDIKVVSMVVDDSGEHISSTRIRQGLVNRTGEVYDSVFKTDIQLPESKKLVLRTPMGTLTNLEGLKQMLEANESGKLAVVGDVSFESLVAENIKVDYAILDQHTFNEEISHDTLSYETRLTVNNPKGSIKAQATGMIKELLNHENGVINIEGEEDLITLPMILLLPLNSLVVYGQPGKGIVVVNVNEESKDKWYRFLKE